MIRTWGSAPRPVGSLMFVNESMEMIGSVSGGCVENAVVRAAMQVLTTSKPEVLHYGISNEDAWAVGLMCGGELEVLVAPFPGPVPQEKLFTALTENRGGVLLSRLDAPTYPDQQFFLPDDWRLPYGELATKAWQERKSQIIETNTGRWFAKVFPPKSQMLIFGAVHLAVELVQLAHFFDFETIVIDPRQFFVEKTQFLSPPHRLRIDWPAEVLPDFSLDQYTYAILLTHDPKIDDQALQILLQSKVGYIGALGSKRTHEKRIERLKNLGFGAEAIARIHAPVGLDIRAQGAKEIALSIMAQVIQVKNQFL